MPSGISLAISGPGPYLFPSDENASGHQKTFKTAWHATLRRAKVSYFRIYDLRSTYATRLSAGGVADEWVTQLLRQGDAKVFKKYSQMKLQMKREALAKLNRQANETGPGFGTAQGPAEPGFGTVLAQSRQRNSESDGAPIDELFWNQQEVWSGRGDSNARPPAPKAGALPGCATPRRIH